MQRTHDKIDYDLTQIRIYEVMAPTVKRGMVYERRFCQST